MTDADPRPEAPVRTAGDAPADPVPGTEVARLQARLMRERSARRQAEAIAERTLREMYDKHQQLVRAEARLLHAQKLEAMGRLAGGVAHDFNNVLAVILAYSTLALKSLPDGHPLRGDMEEIHKAARRGTALTRQILAFSRQQVLQARVVVLNPLVRDLERMLARLIGEDVALRLSLDPALHACRVDPGQMEQVLMNLAVNARDAMPNGGTLAIETGNATLDESADAAQEDVPAGAYVMVTVSDTGTGIDAATLARIFEPFFTTKEAGRGTGLGLATVYGIVKQHGGHVAVRSEPGRGTTFRIYLPRAEAPVERAPDLRRTTGALRGVETVLLVEDDTAVRTMVRDVLARHGYGVIEAADGATALALAAAHPTPIQILLTDVAMPGMSGPELAVRLGSARPATRVLYMSGHAAGAVGDHGFLPPGVALLEKPFGPDDLLARVREVLE